jgi:adhesin transport system membrane fusion protein
MNSIQVDKPPLLARFTIVMVVAFIVAFVIWASYAVVDELARGDGKVIPLSKTQIIQATESGVVQEIAVRLGERVSKGQLLIRLDDTTTSSSLEETQVRLQSYEAQIARLDIEIGDILNGTFECPRALIELSPLTCENEQQLLEARRDNFKKKNEVLAIRLQQKNDELNKAGSRVDGLVRLQGALDKERSKIAPLVKRKLHSELNLIQLDRQIIEQSVEIEAVQQEIPLLR